MAQTWTSRAIWMMGHSGFATVCGVRSVGEFCGSWTGNTRNARNQAVSLTENRKPWKVRDGCRAMNCG
jgi:hypothetical protein